MIIGKKPEDFSLRINLIFLRLAKIFLKTQYCLHDKDLQENAEKNQSISFNEIYVRLTECFEKVVALGDSNAPFLDEKDQKI